MGERALDLITIGRVSVDLYGGQVVVRSGGVAPGTLDPLAVEVMAAASQIPDAAEGMHAFLGKRKPVWRGR